MQGVRALGTTFTAGFARQNGWVERRNGRSIVSSGRLQTYALTLVSYPWADPEKKGRAFGGGHNLFASASTD